VVELLAFAISAVVVLAVLASVFGMVLWLVFLPFRIFGWLLRGFALLVAIPFVAVFGVVAVAVLGIGALMFMLPFLPLALLALGAVWLVRRNRRSVASATS